MSWFNITNEELKFNHKIILETIEEVMNENPNIALVHEITMGVIKKGIKITDDLVVECLIEKMVLREESNLCNPTIKIIKSKYGKEKDLIEELERCQNSLNLIEKELNKRFVFSDDSYDVSLHDGRVRIKNLHEGGYVSDIYLPIKVFEAICRWYYKTLNL